MAFNVNFWTFSKKERSTAQPAAGQATVYSCTANGDLDLLAPVIRLKIGLDTSSPPTVYNYAQIPNFGRYYFVTSWTVKDGLWEAQLKVDPWASWKTQIGNNNLYIYRNSTTWDPTLVDSMFPETSDVTREMISVTPPLYGNGMSSIVGKDCVVGIIGKNSAVVQYRAFNWTQLSTLFDYLMSDGYYVDVLGILGSSDPSAKVAVNPLQYITSIRAYPISLTTDQQAVLESDYYVGLNQMDSTAGLGTFSCYKRIDGITGLETSILQFTETVQLSGLTGHPQKSRGRWINAAHSRYYLSYPPFGVINLDPVLVSNAVSLKLVSTLDITTGEAVLRIYFVQSGSDQPPVTVTGDPVVVKAQAGVEVQLSQVLQNNLGAMQIAKMLPGIFTTAAGAAAANPLLLASGLTSTAEAAIGGITESRISRGDTINHQGSLINYQIGSGLFAEYTWLASDDLAGRGRPLCAVRQISSNPGFIMADPEELVVAGATDPEITELRAGLAGGFYYE